MHQKLISRVSLWLCTTIVPVSVFATSAADVIKTPDRQAVTRGEFIDAAVKALNVSIPSARATTYKGVPAKYIGVVNAANQPGALAVFGGSSDGWGGSQDIDLKLSQRITRGEALSVLVELEMIPMKKPETSFKDVVPGSLIEKAVTVALARHWMEPVNAKIFGVRRVLNGREARILLRKALGEGEGIGGDEGAIDGVQTVTIEIPTAYPEAAPIPKEDLFKEVWNLLITQYMRQEKLDAEEAAYKALEAMVGSLNDPYTVFFRPVAAKEFQGHLQGEFSGIGITIDYTNGVVNVVSPLAGSPAQRAGIVSGDKIIRVDGQSLQGLSETEAVGKIRGPKGTSVKLTILRGDMEFDLTVIRDTITIPEITVSWQGNVAVVGITQFGQITARDIRSTLTAIQAKNPKGIILDLRNNPGGYLDTAVEVVSNFLPQDSLMASIATKSKTFEERTIGDPSIKPEVKLVVLVNKGSASASEIVAGALKDLKRALIVGETTFGKGVVQNVNILRDGSILKVTIAEWITPSGTHIDGKGITPDIEVASNDGRDEQLLEALKLLR